jgi:chromosome segregation ATPase
MDGMLSMVKRRAGIIEQEAHNIYDLQTELEAARETIDAQRQRLEALDKELREARSQATLLQEEYLTAISSLKEALTVARKDNEATQKEAEDTRNLRGELSTIRADNETLRRREAELDAQVRGNAEARRAEEARIQSIEQQLTKARSSLQAISGIEEELNKTQSDLSELREVSGSYIQELKATIDMSAKQLQASRARVTGLEKDLETARQSIKIIKAEANGDKRVRLLKAQLFELNALINLEKEKSRYKTELKATQAAVAKAKADTSDTKRLGDLLGEEAKISIAKSEVERNIVGTNINILKYSDYKVQFQNAKIRYHEGVEHIAIDDIKRTLDKLHNKVLYCFIKGRYTLVEPRRFNDYLGNPSYLADDVEFFYCNPS